MDLQEIHVYAEHEIGQYVTSVTQAACPWTADPLLYFGITEGLDIIEHPVLECSLDYSIVPWATFNLRTESVVDTIILTSTHSLQVDVEVGY